ncbi:hypothetical protein F4808DRAFT_460240 [Astrocystis sublimbata]|nr:hypothetical protein F4808DRAFT_460240 [Astrocystis sublimbata]
MAPLHLSWRRQRFFTPETPSPSPAAPPSLRDAIVSHDYLPEDTLRRGLTAAHHALTTPVARVDYRVVGAAAIWSLGKTDRQTCDFDILVADKDVELARKLLAQDDNFGETRLASLYYKGHGGKNFNVDVVNPQQDRNFRISGRGCFAARHPRQSRSHPVFARKQDRRLVRLRPEVEKGPD